MHIGMDKGIYGNNVVRQQELFPPVLTYEWILTYCVCHTCNRSVLDHQFLVTLHIYSIMRHADDAERNISSSNLSRNVRQKHPRPLLIEVYSIILM